MNVPPGFEPFGRDSPYRDTMGPVYYRRDGKDVEFGFAITAQHMNARGIAHGGVLAGFADVLLGYALTNNSEPNLRFLTLSLSLDFLDGSRDGDWLSGQARTLKIGKRVAVADGLIVNGERPVLRANGTFAVLRDD